MLAEVLAAKLGAAIPAHPGRTWQTRQWADWFSISATQRYPAQETIQLRFAALLAGHIEQESGGGEFLDPKGPAGTGDNGNAFGLAQIDGRYHAPWLRIVDVDGTPRWQKPQANIDYGAGILFSNFMSCQAAAPSAPVEVVEMAAVCGYNADLEKVIAALVAGRDPNALTTDGNYGTVVVGHANKWAVTA